jgi:hypothetical protein
MNKLELKLKISVLWMANTVIDLVQIVLSFFGAGFIDAVQKGKLGPMAITGGQITLFTFSLIVPVAMAFLVFVIPNPTANKWLNAGLAVIIALMSWIDFFARVTQIGPAFIASAFATSIAPTILVFYAWKLDTADE